MTDLLSMTLPELAGLMERLGEKPYRARQIYEWLHKHLAGSPDAMNNIPASLKAKLKAEVSCDPPEIAALQVSALDGTRKYLFRFPDGCFAESVWMQYHHGNTVCISSQVGCRMGCSFCASTLLGLTRNLTAGEMLAQVGFKKKLENHGIHVTIRREMGRDIDGACGQLRKRFAEGAGSEQQA